VHGAVEIPLHVGIDDRATAARGVGCGDGVRVAKAAAVKDGEEHLADHRCEGPDDHDADRAAKGHPAARRVLDVVDRAKDGSGHCSQRDDRRNEDHWQEARQQNARAELSDARGRVDVQDVKRDKLDPLKGVVKLARQLGAIDCGRTRTEGAEPRRRC